MRWFKMHFLQEKIVAMWWSKITKSLPWKDKANEADVKEAELKFHALTPIDNSNLGIYESAN